MNRKAQILSDLVSSDEFMCSYNHDTSQEMGYFHYQKIFFSHFYFIPPLDEEAA